MSGLATTCFLYNLDMCVALWFIFYLFQNALLIVLLREELEWQALGNSNDHLRGGSVKTSWGSTRPSARSCTQVGGSQAQIQPGQRMYWDQPWGERPGGVCGWKAQPSNVCLQSGKASRSRAASGCPEKFWTPYSWKYLGPGWMGLSEIWSSENCPWPWQGDWNLATVDAEGVQGAYWWLWPGLPP